MFADVHLAGSSGLQRVAQVTLQQMIVDFLTVYLQRALHLLRPAVLDHLTVIHQPGIQVNRSVCGRRLGCRLRLLLGLSFCRGLRLSGRCCGCGLCFGGCRRRALRRLGTAASGDTGSGQCHTQCNYRNFLFLHKPSSPLKILKMLYRTSLVVTL